MWDGPGSHFSSTSSTRDPCSASFFLPFLMSATYPKRTIFVFDEKRHSPFGTVSHPNPNSTSSNCLSHKRLASGVRVNFVREVPQDNLQCLTMISAINLTNEDQRGFVQEVPRDVLCSPSISAICAVAENSIRMDILTKEFGAIWERLPILPECR